VVTKGLVLIIGGLTATLAACAAVDLLHVTTTKFAAFEYARQVAKGRGIINLGAGPHRTYQAQIIAEASEILANIDIAPDGLPRFLQLDVERDPLPFADKHFGCAFASHVIEHLDNWQFALNEMVRVADHVVVVLPHPAYFSG
jgi:SAM-dependent methyltransferase